MSGGKWNYGQCNLGYDMFPHSDVTYGLGERDYERSVKEARKCNPMEDRQLSELVFDVLCLIYSADWYKSGDTGEDQYREDVKFFKKKWFNDPSGIARREIETITEEFRKDLMESLTW